MADSNDTSGVSPEERLDRLQRIATALSTLLTPGEVAEVILRDVAPELGGAGRALWLLNDSGTQLELVDPETHVRAASYSAIPLNSDLPGAEVARTGEPIFLTTLEERNRRFPALEGVGPQVSIAALPLTAGGRVVGVLACSYDEEHEFAEQDRRYLMVVTALASQALERSRLHGEQIEIARVLQASLLPPELPEIEGVELAAAYHPAMEGHEVGGDFYDAFPLERDRGWALAVGDVSGTGPAAAAVTAQVRHTLRAAKRLRPGLAAAVTVVNDALAETLDDERFCTMVACRIDSDPDGALLEVVTAGHPPALLLRADGTIEELRGRGWMLGPVPGSTYEALTVRLAPNDAVLLYTDGVIEARSVPDENGERGFFGMDGLRDTIAPLAGEPAKRIVDAVEERLLDYSGGQLLDDVAMLAVRVTA